MVVRGLAETARLKDDLIAALPRSPLLSVNIEVIDEWKPGEMPARAAEAAGEIPSQVHSQEIPVADLLRSRMADRYGADAPQRIAALANAAVTLSRAMRTEGWALRRLAERYGNEGAAPLPRSARWMLEAMVREHLLRLHAEASRGARCFRARLASGRRPYAAGDLAASRRNSLLPHGVSAFEWRSASRKSMRSFRSFSRPRAAR